MSDQIDGATGDGVPGASGRVRPIRTVRQTLGSIVLGFESIVVFLAALVLFGLKNLPAGVALGGGIGLAVVMLLTVGLLRFPWAFVVGWVLQGIVLLAGFVNPVMFFVGAVFTAMWAYAMVKGSQIDRQKETAV
ncbi:DUF4233 domain-containing protein [Compostimonas suwonensis]|uniref:Uncharacterized protein DUF4233 n=1 Tax=Compostimonas suwonensis TaxID=1048394 RepID=A0A2M9BZE6_9MICO|nr:DUF4233 domain-containing protein [Compostimonas suwonensis]PJJ63451.1 uncharacterized protein DUF4233 [Compostimonas suwonensis]